jgi:hypothetical protein
MGEYRNADALAREHTKEAIDVIVDEMGSWDPRVRLEAAKAILDRGHGKPLAAVIAVPASKRLQAQVASMSDEALLDVVTAEFEDVELPALAPPIDPLLQ